MYRYLDLLKITIKLMKKTVLYTLFGGGLLLVLLGFKPNKTSNAVIAENYYHGKLEAFNLSINDLVADVNALDTSAARINTLKKTFAETRLAYKRVEFLMAYLEDEEVEGRINGGPLPSSDYDSMTKKVIVTKPRGLQTIEEAIYAEQPYSEKAKLKDLVQKLQVDAREITERQEQYKLDDRLLLEAARLEVVRAATLGVTGFDTPASGNALNETAAGLESSWAAIIGFVTQYEAEISNKTTKKVQITTLLLDAHHYLEQNKDFNTFDRVFFIKNYANPIFSELLDLQIALNIPDAPSDYAKRASVNLKSRNIFAVDFLDKSFFTKLQPNETTNEVVALGRALFFDPILSGNNKRSCASCHNPETAFTDGNRKSIAFDLATTVPRNAPTIINTVFAQRWFADLRSDDMSNQIKQVVENHKEFNSGYANIVKKIKGSATYRNWFKRALRENVTEASVNKAIIAYEQSLIALSSPFDKYMRGETADIDPAVIRGFNLFSGAGKCATCHFAPTFSGLVPPHFHDSETEVLGVPLADQENGSVIDTDEGRYANKIPADRAEFMKYAFKTPTLRNVNITAPYMHNGVFKTLDDVMVFYNRGGGAALGIDLPNQTLSKEPIRLSSGERDDVIAFMKALTDTTATQVVPKKLPNYVWNKTLNRRKIGGVY